LERQAALTLNEEEPRSMADDNTTTERLVRIEAALAGLATKADIEVAVATAVAGLATQTDLAGVAKNVDVTALGRQLREMRDELRVTSAMVMRLDHMWPDVIEQLRAMVQQQLGILDRLRALEEPPA
jgi:hypothetical protein